MADELSAEQVERARARLQEFYDRLPDDEKAVMTKVLVRASDSDVVGFAAPGPHFSYIQLHLDPALVNRFAGGSRLAASRFTKAGALVTFAL